MGGFGNMFPMGNMDLGSVLPSNIAAVPASQIGQMAMPQLQAPRATPTTMYQHMRAMSMIGRMGRLMGMGAPRTGYNSGRGMSGSSGMGLDQGTGVNPNDMDMGKMNALLGQYGQQMPSNPSPYAMLPNSGFFGAHQRVGGALEGALFGAANTGPADTWGEGISSVARGVLGGTAERARAVNQQYSQPFMQAGMVQHMQQIQQQMDQSAAHEALYKAQAEKDLRSPMPKYAFHYMDSNNQPVGVRPDGTAEQIDAPKGYVKPAAVKNDFGGQPSGLHPYLSQLGVDSTAKPSGDQVNKAMYGWTDKSGHHPGMVTDQLRKATAGAGVSAGAADARQQAGFTQSDMDEAYKAEMGRIKGNPAQLVTEFGLDDKGNAIAMQPGFKEAYIDKTNRTFGKGIYAPKARTPLPSKSTKPAGTWNAVTGKYE